MISKPSSAEFPPSDQDKETNASQPQQTPSSSPELPTGRCMFITTAEKRCSCHAFQRNPVLPGAYCNCGHQASYHSSLHNKMPPPPLPPAPLSCISETECNSPSHTTLLQRLHHLETRHALDRQQWEKELRRERHSRQEDIRTLRETMYSFFQFIERDIPRQFADVEDKIENVVDHIQRLREKTISVEDFSMALDDRVMDLEQADSVTKVVGGGGGCARTLENSQRRGPRSPEVKEETSRVSKSSTSTKRKRGVRIPLPNPPPLFLSE